MEYERTSEKFVIKLLIFVIIMLGLALLFIVTTGNEEEKIYEATVSENVDGKKDTVITRNIKISDTEVQVLATSMDEIYNNSIWCGAFQLAWNNLLDDVAKDNTIDSVNVELINNLNKRSFLEDNLSKTNYYINLGLKTQKLKTEISNSIKKQFNLNSDTIDILDWNNKTLNDPKDANYSRYLLYVLLSKDLKFTKEFSALDNERFGSILNVKYFGIDSSSSTDVRNQVEVLYYDEDGNYAISLTTSKKDEIILAKNSMKTTFEDIYDEVEAKSKSYIGDTVFGENDTLKIPVINLDLVKQYEELNELEFETNKKATGILQDNLQAIQIKLDGSSEKADAKKTEETEDITVEREFAFNDEFTIFIRESGKEKPYLAANIANISLFQ